LIFIRLYTYVKAADRALRALFVYGGEPKKISTQQQELQHQRAMEGSFYSPQANRGRYFTYTYIQKYHGLAYIGTMEKDYPLHVQHKLFKNV